LGRKTHCLDPIAPHAPGRLFGRIRTDPQRPPLFRREQGVAPCARRRPVRPRPHVRQLSVAEAMEHIAPRPDPRSRPSRSAVNAGSRFPTGGDSPSSTGIQRSSLRLHEQPVARRRPTTGRPGILADRLHRLMRPAPAPRPSRTIRRARLQALQSAAGGSRSRCCPSRSSLNTTRDSRESGGRDPFEPRWRC